MTTLRNNFSTGPDGTNLTTANSGAVPGNDAFNAISSIGSGTILKYASAATLERPTAEFVLKTATGSTSDDNTVLWSTAMGNQAQIWLRQYLYLTEVPDDAQPGANDMAIFVCDNGSVYCAKIYIGSTSGKLWLWNGPDTASAAMTNALTLNQWVRIECRMQFSSTTGNIDLKLFLEADAENPTETVSVTNWNLGASAASNFYFGSGFAEPNKPITYYSGLELNNVGWPGPAPFRLGRGMPNGMMTNSVAIHTSGE
jgi:hypothetical protein